MLNRVPLPFALSAGANSASSGTVIFSNSNGLSFGLNGSTITGSYTSPAQFTGGFSTGGNTAGTTGLVTGQLVLAGGPNITLSGSTNGGSMTISVSGGAGAAGNTGFISAGANTASLGTVVFSNSNGVTFGLNGQTMTGSHNGLTSQSTQFLALTLGGNTAGTTTFNASNNASLFLNGGNNITLSGNGSTVTISAANQTVQTQGITGDQLSIGVSTGGNTSGNTTVNNGQRFVLVGSNGITLSQGTGAGSTTVTISGITQSNQSAIKGFGVSNTGNTAGNTGISSGVDWVLAASNSLTLSQSTVGGGPNTVWVQVGAYLTTADLSQNSSKYVQNWKLTGNTAGTTSSAQGTDLWISGGANITVSGNSNTIVISGGAGGGGGNFSAGASNLGNTAGSTGITGTQLVLVGSGPISLSQSTGANGATLSIIAPATSSLSATGAVSISTNGSTISIGAPTQTNQSGNLYAVGNTFGTSSGTYDARTVSMSFGPGLSGAASNSGWVIGAPYLSSFENMEGFAGSSAMTWNGLSVSHAVAFSLPMPGSFSFLRIPVSMTTNSTTIATLASATASASGGLFSTVNAVIYSLGTGASSQSLQSVASGSAGFTMTQQISVTNSTQASYSLGVSQQVNGGAGTTLTTQYSVSNTNYSFTTNQIATIFSGNRMLDIPFANSLSPGAYWMVIGMFSTTSTAGAAGLAALTNCNVRYSNHYGVSVANLSFGIMGATNMTSGGLMGAGSMSTTQASTTASIPLSAISSIASLARMYFQLLRSN